jgi:hypothetical protein
MNEYAGKTPTGPIAIFGAAAGAQTRRDSERSP